MAAARPKNKIERAYTVKDIKSDDLECAIIGKVNMDIYSINENDISDIIKIPLLLLLSMNSMVQCLGS